MPAAGDERRLLQALIQAAAGLHHASRGRPAPGARLLESAREKLGTAPGDFHGLDLERLRALLPEAPDDALRALFREVGAALPP